jgi:Skp family chaperone for outer membrane proteins
MKFSRIVLSSKSCGKVPDRHLILITLLFIVNNSFSQSKTAHINYNQLVLSMPETKKADSLLNALTLNYQAELTRMETEYQAKAAKFQQE